MPTITSLNLLVEYGNILYVYVAEKNWKIQFLVHLNVYEVPLYTFERTNINRLTVYVLPVWDDLFLFWLLMDKMVTFKSKIILCAN